MRPLHYAAAYNKPKIARYLIEEGAEILAKDSQDQLAIHLAAEQGNISVLKELLNKKSLELQFAEDQVMEIIRCQLFTTEKQGNRPIHLALENKRYDSVQIMLERCLEYKSF